MREFGIFTGSKKCALSFPLMIREIVKMGFTYDKGRAQMGGQFPAFLIADVLTFLGVQIFFVNFFLYFFGETPRTILFGGREKA